MTRSPTGLFGGVLLLLSAALSALASAAGTAGASARRQSVSPSPRITNIHVAQEGEFPWQVSLRSTYGQHLCGGALIEEQWVLTSAMCCSKEPKPTKVAAGSLEHNGGLSQIVGIVQTEKHPNYTASTKNHDICLLRLRERMTLNNKTNTIGLPGLYGLDGRDFCIVSGWGAETKHGSLTTKLKKATVFKYTDAHCEQLLPNSFIKATMLCTLGTRNGDPVGPCTGDEGGPLVCHSRLEGKLFLQGIVSDVTDCAAEVTPVEETLPSISTSVDAHLSWINGVFEQYPRAAGGAKKAAPLLGLLVLALAQVRTNNI